ncbi:MICAL-like protein 2a [Rhinoraja longicauda]
MAATKALQQWCKRRCEGYRDVVITNMTTSWRDGLAFCAILHHFRPDLIDFNSLKKDDVYENNKLAFRVAEEELGIPALLDAEDMVALRVPDRLSILTYVSQYHNFFTGRSPIGGLAHIKRSATDLSEEPAQKRLTPETKPKHPKNTRPPNNEPTLHAAPTSRVALASKVPARGAEDSSSKSGTLSSSCAICKKTVLLVQRYLVDGKLYHRNCFRCKQCSTTLMAGAYKSGAAPGTFICINHSISGHERYSHNGARPAQPLVSKANEPAPSPHRPAFSHVTSPASVLSNSKQPEHPPAATGTRSALAEGTQAAKHRFMSSVMPEKESPASPRQSQDPVRGWRSPAETTTIPPRSTGGQEHAGVAVKKPAPTTIPGSDTNKDKARSILQKNLLYDSNNNRNQSSTSSSSVGADKSPDKQPASYRAAKSITLDVSSSENGQEPARSSVGSRGKDSGQGQQAKDSKWKPISSFELTPSPAISRGGGSSEASTNKTPWTSLNRASSMNEATGRGTTPTTKASSKGNVYSPQIITRAQEEESPSDWRSKLRPVQKQHSLGPSDVKQVHSSSVNWDIKKPAESGNALSTPSSLKTTTSTIWTSGATLGNTSTGGGKTMEVTFSLQTPGNVSISTSPASPSKESSPKAGSSQSTQQKKVFKPGAQLSAGVKDPFWSPNAPDKDSSRVKPSEKAGSGPQTPGIGYRSALDRGTEEPVGKQSWVQGKSSIATAREEFLKDIYTAENDKESKDPVKSTAPSEEASSKHRIPEEEIQMELRSLGKELDALEQKGVELEPQLRGCEGDDREDELMVDWFKLIHEKQLLIRRESELVYISKLQSLEDDQHLIDQELRVLMAKAEDKKTEGEKAHEKELMEELLKTVEDRNNIIDRLDEDRVREMEEDQMMEDMISKIDITKETESDLKKKKQFNPSKLMKWFGGKAK